MTSVNKFRIVFTFLKNVIAATVYGRGASKSVAVFTLPNILLSKVLNTFYSRSDRDDINS
jgi:hypothetical protein